MRRRTILAAGLAASLTACGKQDSGTTGAPSSAASDGTTAPRSTAPASDTSTPAPQASVSTDAKVSAVLSRLDPAQMAGQCISVGVVPADSPAYIANLISSNCVGGIFLLGHWTDSAQLRSMVKAVKDAAPQGLHPIIATDHEGGQIQNIRIPSVTRLPSQEELGRLGVGETQKVAAKGARQLADLGVTMIYSPVADVTDPDLGKRNKPIAAHQRGFGTDPATCGRYAAAVVKGHRSAGIVSTTKHFPGIGRIVEDTDFSDSGITDTRTTRKDPFLSSFTTAFDAGSEAVMIASATYSKIDPDNLALFSRTVMTDMLRRDLGFEGVIVSDDLGSSKSVFSVPGGQRARKFVEAGGDQAITADPGLAAPMISALVKMSDGSSAGHDRLADAAGRIISLKLAHGLVDPA